MTETGTGVVTVALLSSKVLSMANISNMKFFIRHAKQRVQSRYPHCGDWRAAAELS